MTLANQITILRILLIAPFVISMLNVNNTQYGNSARYVALAIFLVMAVSDGIDGYLARAKSQASKLGSFLDPMADKLLMTCACLLLASQRASVPGFRLPAAIVVLIVGKDIFLLLGFIILYFMTFQVNIKPAMVGKIATTLQLVMVSAILIAPEMASIIPFWIWILRLLWWSAAATAIIATLVYIRTGTGYIEAAETAEN